MALPRIAFATPSRNAWSETFISAHLKGLKEVVLVFSDGSLPYSADGKPMLTATGPMGRIGMHEHQDELDTDRSMDPSKWMLC